MISLQINLKCLYLYVYSSKVKKHFSPLELNHSDERLFVSTDLTVPDLNSDCTRVALTLDGCFCTENAAVGFWLFFLWLIESRIWCRKCVEDVKKSSPAAADDEDMVKICKDILKCLYLNSYCSDGIYIKYLPLIIITVPDGH